MRREKKMSLCIEIDLAILRRVKYSLRRSRMTSQVVRVLNFLPLFPIKLLKNHSSVDNPREEEEPENTNLIAKRRDF